jgi:hypothetical protein
MFLQPTSWFIHRRVTRAGVFAWLLSVILGFGDL